MASITVLTNIIPPYRTAAFDALHDHACSRGGGLTIIGTGHSEPQRLWRRAQGRFDHKIAPSINLPLGENRQFSVPFGAIGHLTRSTPDVVILGGFSPLMWQASRWATKRAIPMIILFDGWAGSDQAFSNPLRRYLRKTIIARSHVGLVASSRGKDWLTARGIPADHVINAPIPTSFDRALIGCDPALNGMTARTYDIVWCGRTTWAKGFDRFVAIAQRLKDLGTIKRIGIVGDLAPDQTARILAANGLSSITDIKPPVPPDQLPAILQNAKLCLFPSRNDAYGVGVIDAISCGAVALCSHDVGCAIDVLAPPEIIGNADITGWVTACQRLLASERLWRQTAQTQLTHIAQNTPTHHADAMWQAVQMALRAVGKPGMAA
ncbi:glycosyltransferase [Thalassospira sp. MA62]|nr:glycosyltransferase [Thalassospira sp. MA62]